MSESTGAWVQAEIVAPIWGGLWLFTVGYCGLGFWQGLFAMAIWPYYLGRLFAPTVG